MFAVLHIADFALHAVLRYEPDAVGRPAALFANTSKKSVVLAANPLARAAGVELGMTAPQAIARCAQLIIRAPRAAGETEARAALLAVGFTLSPKIEDTAPGVCTIDLAGADLVSCPELCRTAVTELNRLGLPATAGLAATPLLALYAARHLSFSSFSLSFSPNSNPRAAAAAPDERKRKEKEERERSDVTQASRLPQCEAGETPALLLAESPGDYAPSTTPRPDHSRSLNRSRSLSPNSRNLSRTKNENEERERSPKPFGILHSALGIPAAPVLHVTDPASFLAPLPLSAADPSPELAAVFHTWGLRTLGDLTTLPRDEIVRRFGAEGLALWQRAAGGESRPLHPVVPPQIFAAEMEFEHEIETLEPLLFILRRFLDRLTLELGASQHVAADQRLTLRLADETQHARSFRLPEPTADPGILFRALHTHLESLTTAASIVSLRLQLTPARPLVRQQSLFETGLRDPHGFAETLARVSALVGADRVGTPQLEDTHRPDAVKLIAPLSVIPAAAEPPLHPPLGAPLRRFRPPLPARVEFTAHHSTYLWTDHVRGEISAQSPPYPSSGDWWQADRLWQRTEWDIALAEGGLYRLLLVGDAYFLEGEYD